MYCLSVIKSMNARAARRKAAENAFTRHSSYAVSRSGIVLHSAVWRSTVFISGPTAATFLRRVKAARSAAKRDAIINSHF